MRSIMNLYETVSSNGMQDFMEFSPLDQGAYSTLS